MKFSERQALLQHFSQDFAYVSYESPRTEGPENRNKELKNILNCTIPPYYFLYDKVSQPVSVISPDGFKMQRSPPPPPP